MVYNVTKDEFQKEVLEVKGTVLVDFWAPWCGPCQAMGPVVEEIAKERPDIKVCKVDVEIYREMSRQYKILSIPAFLVFENGVEKGRTLGSQPKEQIYDLLNK